MSFMKEILEKNIPIWEECIATPFIQDLQAGTMPIECFKNYMIQDSIYLKHYARVYGKMIYYAQTLQEIQLYYSILSFVTDTESAVRLQYLEQFGMTDRDMEHIMPLPENKDYIDFLLETAEGGDGKEMLMAVLPCMMSYSYIFRRLASDTASRNSRYWDFIEDYADDSYAKGCQEWSDFADWKCGGISRAEKEKLSSIFEKASLLELEFWKMPYRNQNTENRDEMK